MAGLRDHAFLAVLLAVASVHMAQGAVTVRHQFQYKMKPGMLNKVPDLLAAWNGFAANAPAGGKPTLYQCNPDLGISSELYAWSGSTNPNVDVACRLDFSSEAELRKFWAKTFADPKYKELLTWVDGAYRIQYFANVCSYPNAGTYWRHSFEYAVKPVPMAAATTMEAGPAPVVGSRRVMALNRAWYSFCQNAPVKPVSCVFGPDLGIGKELYPSNNPNMDFGGSLDFKNKEDMVAFWKWLYPLPAYQAVVKANVVKASRIQYKATFA